MSLLKNTHKHLPMNERHSDVRLPGFRCGLCPHPIQYAHRWHRDLLIRTALDPVIDAMTPAEIDVPDGSFAFFIQRSTVRVLVVAVHDDEAASMVSTTPPFVVVTRATVRMDPSMEDARAVWAARHQFVSAADRIRILSAFDLAPSHALRDLAALVRSPVEGIDAVLSMICGGMLSISLDAGLSPETKVRKRQPARPASSTGAP